jgi:glycosyltransferase involved in cell wall biosynthesis
MNPKVSVVIKTFNHEDYVAEAIESVLNQTFQDFEIVITDDGSTDTTADVIRSFKDPRINLEISKINEGISLAMNATLNRARGEFVAILNSDDIALPDRLERQVKFLGVNSEVTSLFSTPILIDDEGNKTQRNGIFHTALELPDYLSTTWLRHFFFKGNCLCAPTAMIRRSAIIDCGGYDPRLGSLNDFDYWIRMLVRGYTFHVLPEPVTLFRIRSGLKNASAPTFFNSTRNIFEYSMILTQFRALSRELILDIFQSDIKSHNLSTSLNCDQLLIELALRSNKIPVYLFALNTLYEIAKSTEDCRRLRDVSGAFDLFKLAKTARQNKELIKLRAKIADLGGQ